MMLRLLTLPVLTIVFAAPVGLAVLLLWPVWRGTGTILFEVAEVTAMAFLTFGLSGIAATVAMGQAPRSRRLR